MTKSAGRHAAARRGAGPPRQRHRRLRPVSGRGAVAVLLCGLLAVGTGACGLAIPSIGVRSGLLKLGVTSSGALQVPASTSTAGWYTFSPRPGAIGSSIIAGHIDSRTGPGVFYRLRFMAQGARVYVKRTDGSLAVFRVTAKHLYPKAHFPTADVYGPAPTPQ